MKRTNSRRVEWAGFAVVATSVVLAGPVFACTQFMGAIMVTPADPTAGTASGVSTGVGAGSVTGIANTSGGHGYCPDASGASLAYGVLQADPGARLHVRVAPATCVKNTVGDRLHSGRWHVNFRSGDAYDSVVTDTNTSAWHLQFSGNSPAISCGLDQSSASGDVVNAASFVVDANGSGEVSFNLPSDALQNDPGSAGVICVSDKGEVGGNTGQGIWAPVQII